MILLAGICGARIDCSIVKLGICLTLEYVTKTSSLIGCCVTVGNEFDKLSTCIMTYSKCDPKLAGIWFSILPM